MVLIERIFIFYIHGSVHREPNLIIVQQDATVFSLLYFCSQLYMFRVLAPIIRSSYNWNYSFWHWSTGSATISSQQREQIVADSVDREFLKCRTITRFKTCQMKRKRLFPAGLWVKVTEATVIYQEEAGSSNPLKSTTTCKSPSLPTNVWVTKVTQQEPNWVWWNASCYKLHCFRNFIKIDYGAEMYCSHRCELEEQVHANLYYLQPRAAAPPWQNHHKQSAKTNDWEHKYDNRTTTIGKQWKKYIMLYSKREENKTRIYTT